MPEQAKTLASRGAWDLFDDGEFFSVQSKRLDTFEYFLKSLGTKDMYLSGMDGHELTIVVTGHNGMLVYETSCGALGRSSKIKILDLCMEYPKVMPLSRRSSIYKALRGYFGTTLDN